MSTQYMNNKIQGLQSLQSLQTFIKGGNSGKL
jgi:hypothetical protein